MPVRQEAGGRLAKRDTVAEVSGRLNRFVGSRRLVSTTKSQGTSHCFPGCGSLSTYRDPGRNVDELAPNSLSIPLRMLNFSSSCEREGVQKMQVGSAEYRTGTAWYLDGWTGSLGTCAAARRCVALRC